jgi:hypothetical protein
MPFRDADRPPPKVKPSPLPSGLRLITYHDLPDGSTAMHVVLPIERGWFFDRPERTLIVVGHGSWWYQAGMTPKTERPKYNRLNVRINDELRAKLAEVWVHREELCEAR